MTLTNWAPTATEATAWKADAATEKQVGFINTLIAERDPGSIQIRIAKDALAAGLTKGQASAAISMLMKLPKFKAPIIAPVAPVADPVPAPAIPVEIGIYDLAPSLGEITKIPGQGRWAIVYQGKHGLRVKRLYKSWETKSGFSWKGGSTYQVFPMIKNGKAVKVPLADIQKLGQTFGFCMYCGLMLTDPESRKAGFGPICANKYNLPWGK